MTAAALPSRDGSPLYISSHGDSTDPVFKSGLPYHLLHEAMRQGFAAGALPLLSASAPSYRLKRAAWNLRRVAAGHRRGGFVYSPQGMETLWKPVRNGFGDVRIVHIYQLMAPSVIDERAPRTWFYIDMTLHQLFGSVYEPRRLRDIFAEALALERRCYAAAAGVITRSQWAAASVIADCGVSPAKVHVVLPGANLDPHAYEAWDRAEKEQRGRVPEQERNAQPVRFVYVGYDWKRKGLDRLLRALTIARGRGAQATLRVIGCERDDLPQELRDTAGVEWCGVVSKREAPARFLQLVAECDVGCLPSWVEGAGIALREFAALGLAVLATTQGGSPENAPSGASVLIAPSADDAELADVMYRLTVEDEWRESLRGCAWERRRSYLWQRSVAQLAEIVDAGAERLASAV